MSLAKAHAVLDSWRDRPPRGDDDVRDILEDLLANGHAGFHLLTPPGLDRKPDWKPVRPDRVRRITFPDLWVRRDIHLSDMVVPLKCVRPGDTQVFAPSRPRDHFDPEITDLDSLAEFPSVESVMAGGAVRLRTPLPQVRELFATPIDDETLANLPALERFYPRRRLRGDPVLDPAAAPATLVDLGGNPFGSPEALLRFSGLRRLTIARLYDHSAEVLAELPGLRWLSADPGKGLQHLGTLQHLELLELDIQEGPRMASLKRLSALSELRVLCINGRGLRSLAGIEALRNLEALRLYRPGITDLTPLRELPRLARVRLDGPDRVEDFEPLAALPALRRLDVELHKQRVLSLIEWSRALQERRPEAEILWTEPWPEPGGTAIGAVSYRALEDGSWTIFQDLTDVLGVLSNHDAEDLVRPHIEGEDQELASRLTFDSEGDRFSVTAPTEADIRRAGELVDELAETRSE